MVKMFNLTYMVTEIGIHEDYIVSLAVVEAMDISRSQTEFTSSWLKNNFVFSIDFLELSNSILGTIW